MELPLTIKEAAAGLRRKDYTSVELTEGLLRKTQALNPTLGAFIVINEAGALAAAAAADADFARGVDRSPLQGIPYGAKDIIATADAPTTANGAVLEASWGDGYDATVVAKLRAAGAVLMGKLVLNEFAIGMPDETKPFPMPKNPWDLERSAAGSSSGTGVALASGMILGGLGTDTGGSTRGPAAYNGISGMKQTFGLVSKWGCVPLGYSLDGINPMARTAYDCALMLGLLAGYDPEDPCTVAVPVPDYAAALTGDVTGLRIGVPMSYFFDAPELDLEVKASVLAAIDALKGAGAVVREIEIPYAAEAKDANWIIMVSEAFAYHRPDLGSQFDTYGRYTSEVLARGALVGGSDYVQAQRFRSYFKRVVADAMSGIDVLVVPTMPTTAPLRSEMSPEKMFSMPSFTGLWNLTGLPALAIPTGFSSTGLPLSMQIVGKPFDEMTVLKAGDVYQRLTDWHLQMSPVASEVAV